MLLRTFYNQLGMVNRIIYELPRHEEVNKYTKMTLVEKRGYWYVVADVYSSEGKVTCALAEDKDRVIYVREMDRPVS